MTVCAMNSANCNAAWMPESRPMFDLSQSLTRERVVWIQLQRRTELAGGLIASPFAQQQRAEIRVRVGVVGIDSDQAFELERGLTESALARECHAEVVQRV